MPSTVSVLIPAYNSAALLPETLDSVLSQTLPPAEVIVVDDGSTDNTREILARFGSHVQYHWIENGGPCRARNIAASLATCTHLAFCDSDDLWREDKLEQQIALHEANPAVQFSFTNFVLVNDGIWATKTEFDHAPDRSFPPYSLPAHNPIVIESSFYDRVLAFQPVRPSTIVVTRQLFHTLGGLKEQFGRNPSEDVEFTLRCLQHPPTGIVTQPVVGIRKHTTNFSGSDYRNLLGQIEIYQYALQHHAPSEATRTRLAEQIDVRRIDAAYYAFRNGEFSRVASLLSEVPAGMLSSKLKLKLWIARMPAPLARSLQKLLLND